MVPVFERTANLWYKMQLTLALASLKAQRANWLA